MGNKNALSRRASHRVRCRAVYRNFIGSQRTTLVGRRLYGVVAAAGLIRWTSAAIEKAMRA
jgi:hypothetical protein